MAAVGLHSVSRLTKANRADQLTIVLASGLWLWWLLLLAVGAVGAGGASAAGLLPKTLSRGLNISCTVWVDYWLLPLSVNNMLILIIIIIIVIIIKDYLWHPISLEPRAFTKT